MYSDEVFAFIYTGFLFELLCYLLTKEKFKTLFGNLAVFLKYCLLPWFLILIILVDRYKGL